MERLEGERRDVEGRMGECARVWERVRVGYDGLRGGLVDLAKQYRLVEEYRGGVDGGY